MSSTNQIHDIVFFLAVLSQSLSTCEYVCDSSAAWKRFNEIIGPSSCSRIDELNWPHSFCQAVE
jgi:hypothetical protein